MGGCGCEGGKWTHCLGRVWSVLLLRLPSLPQDRQQSGQQDVVTQEFLSPQIREDEGRLS